MSDGLYPPPGLRGGTCLHRPSFDEPVFKFESLCFGFILFPNNKFLAWNLDKFSYAMHLNTQVKSISKAGQMFALSRIKTL